MNRRSTVALPLVDQVAPTEAADVADIFRLLSDAGRLRILLLLHDEEASVGEISHRIGMSDSATSHALRLLRAHEVVRVRRAGRMAYYSLADQHVRELIDAAVEHQQHARITHPERRVVNPVVATGRPRLRSAIRDRASHDHAADEGSVGQRSVGARSAGAT